MPSKQRMAILVWKQIVIHETLVMFIECKCMHETLAHGNAILSNYIVWVLQVGCGQGGGAGPS